MSGHALRIALALGLYACGSSAARLPGERCAQPQDCLGDTVCICPGGARSCPDAVCTERCQRAADGGLACPSGGSCVDTPEACCQGRNNCTLLCLSVPVCGP